MGQTSPSLCAFLALVAATIIPVSAAQAHVHHASKVRFVEPSPGVFEAARREAKPVFLLISAVWCYWCRQFNGQVLEDAEVATYLNQRYVSVFADYDRRPDVVRKYARGLPMTVLFGADGQVRQSFAGVLKKEDFLGVIQTVAISPPPATGPLSIATAPALPVTPQAYGRLTEAVLSFVQENLDTAHGGFGTGDKHPQPRLLAYLLQRHQATGDRRYLVAVEKTLDGILGALYDRVDGGFFRYAEGRAWSQPHYEKLLHLNAALAAVLSEAHRATGHSRYRQAADTTLAYLLRTLHDPAGGGFYSSQSADPAYYRLPLGERRAARRPPVNRDKITAWNAEAAIALLALGRSSGRTDLRDIARRTLEFMQANVVGEKGAFHIYEHRTGRKQGQGQVDANAWTALAFLEGYRVLGIEAHRKVAERVLDFSIAELFDPGRGAFGEARGLPPTLDANGVMAEALVRAHRAGGRADYQVVARRVLAGLGETALEVLADDDGVTRAAEAAPFLQAYAKLVGSTERLERR